MSLNIRTQLVIFTLLVTGMVGGAITLYSIHLQRVAIYEDFQVQGQALTNVLSETLIGPLYELKVKAASLLLAAAKTNPDVLRVYALDVNGLVLSDGTEENTQRDEKLPEFSAIRDQEAAVEGIVSQTHEQTLSISNRIATPGGELLGYVYIELSLQRAFARSREQVLILIGAVTVLFILGGLVARTIARWFTDPIHAIASGTQRISDGDLKTRISVTRSDELGDLATSINEMTEMLGNTTVSKQYMDDILHSMSDGLIVVDDRSIIRAVNKAILDMFGIEEAKLVNIPMNRFFTQEVIDEAAHSIIQDGDAEIILESGSIPVSFSRSPMLDKENNVVGHVYLFCDVTERQELESQLQQSQKLESIGQLAAGIAHEINTPIQFIGDNTRFLQESFAELTTFNEKSTQLIKAANACELSEELIKETHAVMEDTDLAYLNEEIPNAIDQTLEGVGRVAQIVGAMKDFSHPGTDKKLMDLNRAIETTITVARNEWKYVAEMVTDFDSTLPPVPCLAGEVNQVILNMIVNAAHAISEAQEEDPSNKGTITVSTRRVDDWVEVRLSDTGTGIPEEIRSRVFDHFFTTKEVGKGTGQGLSIAHGVIVKKHGGEIKLDSDVGKGSTFIIRLPLQDPDELSAEEAA